MRQRFAHRVRRSLGKLLDEARLLERAMMRAGQQIEPASVLIRSSGLDVRVTVHSASAAQAAREARRLIALLAVDAGVDDLGDDDGPPRGEAEPVIRPWDQDERPAWRVVAEWGSPRERYDVDDLRLLAKVLEETGMTRQVVLESGVGELRVSMLVKAVDVVAAEHAAVKIVEVAYTVAGLGHLGMNLSSRATRQPST